jgi:hypothetical protein
MHKGIYVLVLLLSRLTGLIAAAPVGWTVVEQFAARRRIEAALSIGKTLKGKIDHVTPASVFLSPFSASRSSGRLARAEWPDSD